ncbi:unnamed protein product [Vitrella brassicaformis CCMP3155]|uniref:Uncharacterized protein n=2 Tax=Vitrella brassicaformis TaxID=1169539 RepID=A0A0G4GDX0_VITBC|nr:unnamed protein product [Vitrella brassicaformis CCMP3155]|eukprot:CEM27592.1 unnamed protein product [Vitrella brassicaformis CCMP3155]
MFGWCDATVHGSTDRATKQLASGLAEGDGLPSNAVTRLLEAKAEVKAEVEYMGRAETLLEAAARTCEGDDGALVLKALIEAGADVNAEATRAKALLFNSEPPISALVNRLYMGVLDKIHGSCFHSDYAANCRRADFLRTLDQITPMVRTLLAHRADPNRPSGVLHYYFKAIKDYFTADHPLDAKKRLEFTSILLDGGARVVPSDKWCSFHVACEMHLSDADVHVDIMRRLMTAGGAEQLNTAKQLSGEEEDHPERGPMPPLWREVGAGNTKVAQYLISEGAEAPAGGIEEIAASIKDKGGESH